MSEEHISTLMQMQTTGKDIAAIFAGSVGQDKVMAMTQALLEIMGSDNPILHESRMMLLGALAALGQEVTYSVFADIGGSHEPPPAEIAP
jgi:hypothetical protein